MGTRSMIGFEEYDGSVTAIYCHYDGYIEHNGKILLEHYNSIDAVDELLDLGSLSTLGKEIGVKHPFSYVGENMPQEEYNTLYGDMCVSYSRDRGESDALAETYSHIDKLFEQNPFAEYYYIYDGIEWFVYARAYDKQIRRQKLADLVELVVG